MTPMIRCLGGDGRLKAIANYLPQATALGERVQRKCRAFMLHKLPGAVPVVDRESIFMRN